MTGRRPLQTKPFVHTAHAESLDRMGARYYHAGKQAGGACGHSHSRRPAHSALVVDASQNSVRMAYTWPVTRRRAARERSRPSYATCPPWQRSASKPWTPCPHEPPSAFLDIPGADCSCQWQATQATTGVLTLTQQRSNMAAPPAEPHPLKP